MQGVLYIPGRLLDYGCFRRLLDLLRLRVRYSSRNELRLRPILDRPGSEARLSRDAFGLDP
jgi:hypothetical protein